MTLFYGQRTYENQEIISHSHVIAKEGSILLTALIRSLSALT